jgi:hypothetical protein
MIGNLRRMRLGLRGCVLVLASVGMAGASTVARVNWIHRSTFTADLTTPNGGAYQPLERYRISSASGD